MSINTCQDAILLISDGTTVIDLLDPGVGFMLGPEGWFPQIADYKGEGVWQDSPLMDGRDLADGVYDDAVETFPLSSNGHDQDSEIRGIQDLLRLLRKADDYWLTDWQNEPVWIEARAPGETNSRFAIIKHGELPELDDVYGQPFFSPYG